MAKILRLVCALALGFWLVGCDNIKTKKVYWDDGKTLRADYSYIVGKNYVAVTVCKGVDLIPKARLRGPYKCYYENGTIEEEGEWADDGKNGWMNVGVKRYYYENGQPKWEYNYNSKGKREGNDKSWYENGQLKYESQYKNNQLNGVYKSYYKNGILKDEKQYKNGKKDGYEREYNGMGVLVGEALYKEGKEDGYRREYDKNGVLIRERFYKEGKEIKQ